MTEEEQIAQKIAQVAATANLYPGVIIVHHVPTRTVRYMSDVGLELLGTTLEALRALGPAYATTYFNPVESVEYMAKIWSLLAEGNLQQTKTFFQQVRTTERPDWSWYLTSMRLLMRDAAGEPLLVIFVAAPMDPDSHFAAKTQRLIDENNFLRQHEKCFASLTAREREVLRHLALGRSSAEIAGTLHLSVQTADTHRRNIRRKLSATSAFELGQYARAFGLI